MRSKFRVGGIYTLSKYCWFTYETVESASNGPAEAASIEQAVFNLRYWSEKLGSRVSFLKPNDNFMVTELCGDFVFVVGSDTGGWVWNSTKYANLRKHVKEIVSCS